MRFMAGLLPAYFLFVLGSGCNSNSQTAATPVTALPNGWRLSPVGRVLETSDLILKLQPLDGGSLAAVHSGFTSNGILRINTASEKIEQSLALRSTWYGMDFDPSARRLFVSGGNEWTNAGAQSPIY